MAGWAARCATAGKCHHAAMIRVADAANIHRLIKDLLVRGPREREQNMISVGKHFFRAGDKIYTPRGCVPGLGQIAALGLAEPEREEE
jgi:hypothetical protein